MKWLTKAEKVSVSWRAAAQRLEEHFWLLQLAPVDTIEWKQQSDINSNPIGRDDLELGFATFFSNRTHRARFLEANLISGFEQTGNRENNSRYDKEPLSNRIPAAASMRSQNHISELDVVEILWIPGSQAEPHFVYPTPSYVVQANHFHGSAEFVPRAVAEELQRSSCKRFAIKLGAWFEPEQ